MKRLELIILSSVCLILLAASSAMAFGEIRYPDRPLNLRAGRTASDAWVGSLYPGQKVRVGFLQDGWYAIFEPGETKNTEAAAVGYSNAKFLKKQRERHEPKKWGELVQAIQNLNIRSKPSRGGAKIGMLSAGEKLVMDFVSDEWAMIFSTDATIRSKLNRRGYANVQFLVPTGSVPVQAAAPKAKVAPAPASTTQPKLGTTAWGKVITVPGKINLRQKRTSGSKLVRTLQPGETVRVDFLENGWYAVFQENEPLRREKRAMGYALKTLLDKKSAQNVNSIREVATSGTGDVAVKEGPRTIVIPKKHAKPASRPDPGADKIAHGYQYKLLETAETKKFGESWISLKVFLSTSKLPSREALEDFATTLWEEHRRANRNLAVLIYLPGMNTEDLAYGVVQFSDEGLLETWVRRVTLFGTPFQH